MCLFSATSVAHFPIRVTRSRRHTRMASVIHRVLPEQHAPCARTAVPYRRSRRRTQLSPPAQMNSYGVTGEGVHTVDLGAAQGLSCTSSSVPRLVAAWSQAYIGVGASSHTPKSGCSALGTVDHIHRPSSNNFKQDV